MAPYTAQHDAPVSFDTRGTAEAGIFPDKSYYPLFKAARFCLQISHVGIQERPPMDISPTLISPITPRWCIIVAMATFYTERWLVDVKKMAAGAAICPFVSVRINFLPWICCNITWRGVHCVCYLSLVWYSRIPQRIQTDLRWYWADTYWSTISIPVCWL